MKIELKITPEDLNGASRAILAVEDLVLKHVCVDRRPLKITVELTSFDEERDEIVAQQPEGA